MLIYEDEPRQLGSMARAEANASSRDFSPIDKTTPLQPLFPVADVTMAGLAI